MPKKGDKESALRMGRWARELVQVLYSGKWYNTVSLAMVVGGYIRPASVMRAAKRRYGSKGTFDQGTIRLVGQRLAKWHQQGRVERSNNTTNGYPQWRLNGKTWATLVLGKSAFSLVPINSSVPDCLTDAQIREIVHDWLTNPRIREIVREEIKKHETVSGIDEN
jgi:hypothetical protein